MIGAVIVSTKAQVCGAPLAAYLTRDQSRFWMSCKTFFTRIDDFIDAESNDHELASDENSTPLSRHQRQIISIDHKNWRICKLTISFFLHRVSENRKKV